MVSGSSAGGVEYSKIGIQTPQRRSYGGPVRCLIAFVTASIAVCLLFLLLRSPSPPPPPRPGLAHISHPPSPSPSLSSNLFFLCNTTSYPLLCLHTLSSFPSATSAPLHELLALVASVALHQVNQSYSFALNLTRTSGSDAAVPVLQDCLGLMDSGKDELNSCIARLSHLDPHSSTFRAQVKDVQVWLSASFTDQDTCLDGFQDMTGEIKDQMVKQGDLICKILSIALSLAETLQSSSQNSNIPAAAPMRS